MWRLNFYYEGRLNERTQCISNINWKSNNKRILSRISWTNQQGNMFSKGTKNTKEKRESHLFYIPFNNGNVDKIVIINCRKYLKSIPRCDIISLRRIEMTEGFAICVICFSLKWEVDKSPGWNNTPAYLSKKLKWGDLWKKTLLF